MAQRKRVPKRIIKDDDLKKKVEMVAAVQARQTLKVVKCPIKNVLIVGKTKIGKSTLIKLLCGVDVYVEEGSMYSITEQALIHTFAIMDKEQNNNFTLNVIDTPGFGEIKKDGDVQRTDEALTSIILTLLKFEITKLHTIIMCCSPVDTGLKEIELMDSIYKKFNGKVKAVICLTKAETLDEDDRKRKVKDLKENKTMKQILGDDEPYFSGALDLKKRTLEQLEGDLETLEIDRMNLMELIQRNETFVEIKDLPVIKTEAAKAHLKQQSFHSSLKMFTQNELKLQNAPTIKALFQQMESENNAYTILGPQEVKLFNTNQTLKRQLNARIWRDFHSTSDYNVWDFIRVDSSWDREIYIVEELSKK